MRLTLPEWAIHPRFFWIWLWRLIEQEVADVVEPETMGPPDYNYGRVEGLFPDIRVMTEMTESPVVCCGYCSAGMVCRAVKPGLSPEMKSTAHAIRRTGGRPHNAGSRASELRAGADEAHDVVMKAIAKSEIRSRLRAEHAVCVNLDYHKLPAYLRVQSGQFGHSVMLYGIRQLNGADLVGFFDPLWPQGAKGAWTRWTDIDQALWGDGEHSSAKAKADPAPPIPPRPEPPTPKPPEPAPEPPQTPVTPDDGAITQLDLWRASAASAADRDVAWVEATSTPIPYDRRGVFGPTDPMAPRPGRWSRFVRWGQAPVTGWNSGEAWDQARWDEG